MSTHAEDPEQLYEIVAEVDKSDPRAALLGTCYWCGYGPPVCYGAALFVTCTGPRPKVDLRSDDVPWDDEEAESGKPMPDDMYTNDGA